MLFRRGTSTTPSNVYEENLTSPTPSNIYQEISGLSRKVLDDLNSVFRFSFEGFKEDFLNLQGSLDDLSDKNKKFEDIIRKKAKGLTEKELVILIDATIFRELYYLTIFLNDVLIEKIRAHTHYTDFSWFFVQFALYRDANVIETIFLSLHKANIRKIRDEKGSTPLHFAAKYGIPSLVRLFLRFGENPNENNQLGQTPLALAFAHKPINDKEKMDYGDAITFLLKANALLPKERRYYTDFSWFFYQFRYKADNVRMIEKIYLDLHKLGIKNIKDENGATPLHFAAMLGLLTLVKLCLAYNENIDAVNHEGATPLMLAIKYHVNDYKEIITLLVKLNAVIPYEHRSLHFLKLDFPPVGLIQHYHEDKHTFLANKLDVFTKNVAVLFFAEYDHEITSPYFGAVTVFYDLRVHWVQQLYHSLAKDFHVVRVMVSDTQQILASLQTIKAMLPATSEIQHLMIHAHGSPSKMQLGKQITEFTFLEKDDSRNNYVMTKICHQILAKNATIALYGCSTASGTDNLTRGLSIVLKESQVIFGSPRLAELIHYKVNRDGDKPILFPFFTRSEPDIHHVAAYQQSEEIARGEWTPIQARL